MTSLARPLLARPIYHAPRLAPRCLPSARHQSQSTTAASAAAPPSKDPDHPHLYYHALPHRGTALSFLPDPVADGSRVVLGYIPARGRQGGQAGLEDFEENKGFLPLMHSAIRSALAAGTCPTVETEASLRPGDGYLHITDERRLPPAGRIGETEDLLGSVLVQGGKIVPDTYEPQPMYRLVTADGPTQLPEGIDEHVMGVLRRVAEEERGAAGEKQ